MSHDRGCFKCGDDRNYYCGQIDCPQPVPDGSFKGEIRNSRERAAAIELRPPLAHFSQEMERKLRLRDPLHQGHPHMNMDQLMLRLIDEARELVEALRSRDLKSIRGEAVDVANFAMLIFKRTLQCRESETGTHKFTRGARPFCCLCGEMEEDVAY